MIDHHVSTATARRLLSAQPPGDLAGPAGWTRRSFLRAVGLGVGGAAFGGFDGLWRDARDAFAGAPLGAAEGVLVLITMYGGNDGLDTVIPVSDSAYTSQRGAMAIPPATALSLDTTWGLHPGMPFTKSLWDAGRLGIVHGSAYPNPDLSHFSSMATWMHGWFPGGPPTSGWVGRWLDGQRADRADMAAATIDSTVPLHMTGVQRRALGIPDEGGMFGAGVTPADGRMFAGLRAMSVSSGGRGPWHDTYAQVMRSELDVAARVGPSLTPEVTGTELVRKLTLAARLVNADLGLRVVDLGRGGFDTHDNEPGQHARLLRDLDDGLRAFYATLDSRFANRVTLLTLSEFGRTSYANDSSGTDHGTANVQFVIGDLVRGGHHGSAPSLTDWDSNNRLRFTVDFRSVLGSVIDGWLDGGGSTILGGEFENLQLFRGRPGTAVASPPPPGTADSSRLRPAKRLGS